MAYLVLDLDLTVWAISEDVAKVHSAHQLSDQTHPLTTTTTDTGTLEYAVRIINPHLLTVLIEHACLKHDGIVFLSAGYWDEKPVKTMLKATLNLSEKAKEKIEQAHFLTPFNTLSRFPELSLEEIKSLSKKDRLKNHVAQTPQLVNKRFVALDDRKKHTDSFAQETHVIAIRATTKRESQTFYAEAMAALDRMKDLEDDNQITSATSTATNNIRFFGVNPALLKQCGDDIKETEDQNTRPLTNSPALEENEGGLDFDPESFRRALCEARFLNTFSELEKYAAEQSAQEVLDQEGPPDYLILQ